MSRENPADEADTTSPEALDEWLEETAENRNVSKTEIFNRMLSSYWIFQELSEMVSDSGEQRMPIIAPDRQKNFDFSSEETAGEEQEPSESAEGGTEGGNKSTIDNTELLGLLLASGNLTQAAELVSPHPSENTGQNPNGQMVRSPTVKSLQDELNELRQEISKLSAAVDQQGLESTAESDQSTSHDIVNKLTEIKDTLDDLSRVDMEQNDGPDTHLSERIEVLEQELGEISDNLESEVKQLDSSQTTLEHWIDDELDSIEQVFEKLFARTDELERRFDTEFEAVPERIRDMEQYVNRQQELAELKREANDHGISTAVCDHCSEDVDLRLLMEPNCPSCGRAISGISPASWVPFRSNIIETEADQGYTVDDTNELNKTGHTNDDTTESTNFSSSNINTDELDERPGRSSG